MEFSFEFTKGANHARKLRSRKLRTSGSISSSFLSVLCVVLALEQPQAAADHGEKVVDVEDDELCHVRYRPHRLPPPAATAPRESDRGPVWHKIPETSPSDPTSGISTHLEAMRPLPPSRTTRTFGLNACCTPRATPALSTSTITSSSELSVEAVEGLSIVSLICMSASWPSIVSTERRLRPVHEGGRRWVAD